MTRQGLVMLAIAVTLLVFGPMGQAGAEEQPLTKLRVVHVPVLIFAPLYVAIERGYFARQGIDVELIGTPGGLSSFAVLASGRAEVVVGGLGASLFNAAARGLDFKVVGPVHMERPPVSTPLVVSKNAYDNGEIRSVADLRGKKGSVNVIGSAEVFRVQRALPLGGPDIEDQQQLAPKIDAIPVGLGDGALPAGGLGGA